MRLPAALRTRVLLVTVLIVAPLPASACGRPGGPPPPAVGAAPSPTLATADTDGGACYLLDYDVIGKAIGTQFGVSAASQAGDTYTCVLQQAAGPGYPDLTLAVSPTDADPAIFTSTVQPKGAAPVANLGKVGYAVALPPSGDAGPGVEVGWLSGNGRLLILRYRFPPPASAADAATMVPKLSALAQTIDRQSL
jgi:hypothetical protein